MIETVESVIITDNLMFYDYSQSELYLPYLCVNDIQIVPGTLGEHISAWCNVQLVYYYIV